MTLRDEPAVPYARSYRFPLANGTQLTVESERLNGAIVITPEGQEPMYLPAAAFAAAVTHLANRLKETP